MALELSDLGPLNAAQEAELARYMRVSIKEVMAKKEEPCTIPAKTYARKLMPRAISAANKVVVLRRRGVLPPDTEDAVRKIVGEIGIFLGKGTFKSTFTTIQVFGAQDTILAKYKENQPSRRSTRKLLSELRHDLLFLYKGGKKLEHIIPKSSGNYLLESPYLSIACYVQGLSETALTKLRERNQ
jgi:hypothetical protein